MRKLRTKIGAMIASAMLAVALMAMPAGAATTYTPVQGGTFEFDKYLVMKTDASVPNVSVSFTIAPGNAGAAGSGIYAGNDARVQGNPVITGTAAFQAGDMTYDTVQVEYIPKFAFRTCMQYHRQVLLLRTFPFKEPGCLYI